MATLKEVAKLAGVDPSVVSRVINNKEVNIREDTRERVLEAVRTLNYRPNHAARSLRKGETKVLGMLIPDFRNAVYAEIIHGAESKAASLGYSLMLYSIQGKNSKEHYIPPMLEERIEGLLLASSEIDDSLVLQLNNSGMPFVLVNRLVSGLQNFVVADDMKGAQKAVEHLTKLGHTKIAHIAGPLFIGTGLNRLQGYRSALKDANIHFESKYIIESPYSIEGGHNAMNELLSLSSPPTAVFASNVMICLGAMQAIQQKGLSIPVDISVIGFHDVYFASTLNPPLTTVEMPLYHMGEVAVEKLISIIKGIDDGQGITLSGSKLIVRKSTKKLTDY